MLGCCNPNLGQMWTNPNVGLDSLKNLQLGWVEILHFKHLGLSIFDPNLG